MLLLLLGDKRCSNARASSWTMPKNNKCKQVEVYPEQLKAKEIKLNQLIICYEFRVDRFKT